MGSSIFGMSGDRLERMEEAPFDLEDTLQALIAEHPGLLDGAQITPENPRRWMLVTREKGVAAAAGGQDWWSLDHLYLDQDARPTLVEVKRGPNSEIRRKVVGQMLDYAAHAEHWTADELRKAFEESNDDPDGQLRDLLGEGGGEADAFWEKVATNLAAKNLRLLFVADEIPDTLARVVEFLNEQMPRIEVLAVEVKQFTGESSRSRVLVPRVFGRSAAPPPSTGQRPPPKTYEAFMAELPTEEARAAAKRLFDAAAGSGAALAWGSNGVSIRRKCSIWDKPVTVAWFFPPGKMGWMNTRDFSFGAGIFAGYDPPPPDRLLSLLDGWAEQFRADSFTADASSEGVKAWAVRPGDVVKHIDLLEERLRKVLADLAAL